MSMIGMAHVYEVKDDTLCLAGKEALCGRFDGGCSLA